MDVTGAINDLENANINLVPLKAYEPPENQHHERMNTLDDITMIHHTTIPREKATSTTSKFSEVITIPSL